MVAEECLSLACVCVVRVDLCENDHVTRLLLRLGFVRLVCYVIGIENIRDDIAYPRYPGNTQF